MCPLQQLAPNVLPGNPSFLRGEVFTPGQQVASGGGGSDSQAQGPVMPALPAVKLYHVSQ